MIFTKIVQVNQIQIKNSVIADNIISTVEVARLTGRHPKTVRQWIKNKELKAYTPKGARDYIIFRSDLEDLCAKKNITIKEE